MKGIHFSSCDPRSLVNKCLWNPVWILVSCLLLTSERVFDDEWDLITKRQIILWSWRSGSHGLVTPLPSIISLCDPERLVSFKGKWITLECWSSFPRKHLPSTFQLIRSDYQILTLHILKQREVKQLIS